MARIAAFKLQSSNVAMVLGCNILLHNVTKKDFLKDTDWLCHELQHVKQWKHKGYAYFLANYLWLSIKYGYTKNPYEVEARKNACNLNILNEFEVV